MYFLHLRVALTALAMQHPQHYICDRSTKYVRTRMYEYQKDPLYQPHVLSIEEIEKAHRRAKKLQSTAFVKAIQNLFDWTLKFWPPSFWKPHKLKNVGY